MFSGCGHNGVYNQGFHTEGIEGFFPSGSHD